MTVVVVSLESWWLVYNNNNSTAIGITILFLATDRTKHTGTRGRERQIYNAIKVHINTFITERKASIAND